MILLLAVIVLSVGAGYLVGGRLRRFEQLHLRWWALAPIGLALQVLPLPELGGDADRLLGVSLLIASYVLLLLFAWLNLRVAGFPLAIAGLALNLIVIAANGGMPVSRQALVASGQGDSLQLLIQGEGEKHHLLRPGDVITPLADVIGVGGPIRQVVSVGDVLVYAGVAWLVVAVMRGQILVLPPCVPAQRRGYRGKHRPRPDPQPVLRAGAPPAATRRSGTEP